MSQRPVIALDADGVLLDFHIGYATAWERAFGAAPALKNSDAYWCIDRFNVPRLAVEQRKYLRRFFDETIWSTLPAMPGAVEACQRLCAAGYELVCVSAIVPEYREARQFNLRALGLPISHLVATGNAQGPRSPKADALFKLRPQAFVDDYAPYFAGIHHDVHAALIHGPTYRTPNVGEHLAQADSIHANLLAFAEYWLDRREGPFKTKV